MSPSSQQLALCTRYGATPCVPLPGDKAGVAIETLSLRPLNGLRHAPEAGTCGWYIWGGRELLSTDDFFEPLHVVHFHEMCPELLRFLAVPVGWRFLVAGDYEDVWFDAKLLQPT